MQKLGKYWMQINSFAYVYSIDMLTVYVDLVQDNRHIMDHCKNGVKGDQLDVDGCISVICQGQHWQRVAQ